MSKLTIPVPTEHREAIGAITITFAYLESSIHFWTWMLLSSDQRLGQIVTAELSFRNSVNLLCSLFKYRVADEGEREKLALVLRRVAAAEEKRNMIVHSQWGGGPEKRISRFKTTAKHPAGLKHNFALMSSGELHEIADDIAVVAEDLEKVMVNVQLKERGQPPI